MKEKVALESYSYIVNTYITFLYRGKTLNSTITIRLAKVIEQAEIDMLSDRLITLQTMERNSTHIDVRRFENATAFSSKIISGPAFHTVKGMTFTKNELDEIISYYHTLGTLPL